MVSVHTGVTVSLFGKLDISLSHYIPEHCIADKSVPRIPFSKSSLFGCWFVSQVSRNTLGNESINSAALYDMINAHRTLPPHAFNYLSHAGLALGSFSWRGPMLAQGTYYVLHVHGFYFSMNIFLLNRYILQNYSYLTEEMHHSQLLINNLTSKTALFAQLRKRWSIDLRNLLNQT